MLRGGRFEPEASAMVQLVGPLNALDSKVGYKESRYRNSFNYSTWCRYRRLLLAALCRIKP